MNTYETLKRLTDIIGELTSLYGELSLELPSLEFARDYAPVNSELKKIAVKY